MRVVLTDLTTKRWQGVNMSNIQRVVELISLKEIFGEVLDEGDINFSFDISLSKATHRITDIKVEGNQIKGNLIFIQTENGKTAKNLFDMGHLKPSIRAVGVPPSDIHKIFTWDLVYEKDFKKKNRLVKIDQILDIINDYEDTDNI